MNKKLIAEIKMLNNILKKEESLLGVALAYNNVIEIEICRQEIIFLESLLKLYEGKE